MGIVNQLAEFQTLKVRFDDEICFIQIYRPDANNTINDCLVNEFIQVLEKYEKLSKIVVLEGLPEVFCFGADFNEIKESSTDSQHEEQDPGPLYDLWLKLASGPYITIAHVRGKANAGGIGFVAACDLVICEEKAVFSLSELLFGLMPACVLPFIIRRMGYAKANFLTLMTQPISAQQAHEWGLVDAYEEKSQNLLRKQLLRLRRLSKSGIARYKSYMNELDDTLIKAKPKAIAANKAVFADEENAAKIIRYVKTGQFPWEED
ncbi:enoyl-CoA hydratase/isomerase [Colwelliaceae bacterium 6441]